MPTTPLYLHRLDEGIEALRSLAADWIDRRTVEETLSIGKCTA